MQSFFSYAATISFAIAVIGFLVGRVDEWQQRGKLILVVGLIAFALTVVPSGIMKAIEAGQEQARQQQIDNVAPAPSNVNQ